MALLVHIEELDLHTAEAHHEMKWYEDDDTNFDPDGKVRKSTKKRGKSQDTKLNRIAQIKARYFAVLAAKSPQPRLSN